MKYFLQPAWRYGIIGGGIIVAIYVLLYVVDIHQLIRSMDVVPYAIIMPLMLLFGAVWVRATLPTPTFSDTTKQVFRVPLIAFFIADAALLLLATFDITLPQTLTTLTLAGHQQQLTAQGLSATDIDRHLAALAQQDNPLSFQNSIFHYFINLILAFLLSLFVSAMVQWANRRIKVND